MDELLLGVANQKKSATLGRLETGVYLFENKSADLEAGRVTKLISQSADAERGKAQKPLLGVLQSEDSRD